MPHRSFQRYGIQNEGRLFTINITGGIYLKLIVVIIVEFSWWDEQSFISLTGYYLNLDKVQYVKKQ